MINQFLLNIEKLKSGSIFRVLFRLLDQVRNPLIY